MVTGSVKLVSVERTPRSNKELMVTSCDYGLTLSIGGESVIIDADELLLVINLFHGRGGDKKL